MTWVCVDFDKRTINVEKKIEFRYGQKQWRAAPPKTMSGFRTIPMTDEAYDILRFVYEKRSFRKESPLLEQELEYIDPRSGRTRRFRMKDLVFINFRTGEPTKNSSYDTNLYKICESAGIKPFCMHAIRHTFATRCIERGVKPKALQKILGHSNLSTTMDTYVHMTDESLEDIYDIPGENVLHVHGEVGDDNLALGYPKGNYTPKKYSYDVRQKGRGPYAKIDIEEYIDGIEDYSVRKAYLELVETCKSFYKEMRIDLLESFFDNNACNIEEIIVYGHSCAIDYEYFEYINKRFPQANWKFYTKGENQRYNTEILIEEYGITNAHIEEL